MHVLLITQYFPPDITAASFRMGDLCQSLASEGYKVTVVTSYPHRVLVREESAHAHEVAGIAIHRTKVLAIGRGGVVRYVAHYLSYAISTIFVGLLLWLKGTRPDVVVSTSPPLFAGLAGLVLSRLFKRPLVLDVRDLWPESAVSAGQLREGGAAFRIGKMLENILYARARSITCVARPMAAYIRERAACSVTVVYNGVRGDVHASNSPATMSEHDFKWISYVGNLGRVQELPLLIKAIRQLVDSDRLGHWRVRFVGDGAVKQDLVDLTRELGLESFVMFEPAVSRDAAHQFLRESNLLYLSLKSDPVLRMTIPSKVFDYMLADRPILAGIQGEGREILERTGANVCFEPGDMKSLTEMLLVAMDRSEALSAAAYRNRNLVLEEFTRDKSFSRFKAVLEGLYPEGR
jgi:glycosyltransferase involved in cell wall biosynthesis